MMKPDMAKRILYGLLFAAIGGLLLISLTIARVQFSHADVIRKDIQNLDAASYAIVLGASVRQDGTPSDALYDRVITAAEAFRAGKVERLLMTGDDGKFHSNEVEAMARIAAQAGVPEGAIDIDGHGYRTYESCKRAAQVYNIKQAVIITQRFHLGRALYLCSAFGIDVQGLAADKRPYAEIVTFSIRDLLASFKAWLDINVWAPDPPVSAKRSTPVALGIPG